MTIRLLVSSAIALTVLTSTAFAGEFDGTWSGSWGHKSSAKIRIANDKVTAYYYQGEGQGVTSTTVSGKKLTFGASDYKITMTLTGKKSAHATYKGHGTAEAELTR